MRLSGLLLASGGTKKQEFDCETGKKGAEDEMIGEVNVLLGVLQDVRWRLTVLLG